MKIELREWQKEALAKIKSVLGGSIVEAGTGTGKTIVGIQMTIENPLSRFLIVVPTIVLQKQWAEELVKFEVVKDKNEISYIGGGHPRELPTKRITIAVINSLRTIDWTHPIAKFDCVIIDECHRSASIKNISFLGKGTFGYKLGLSATVSRPDGRHNELYKYIGPVVYKINNKQAIEEGYICEYETESIPCEMVEYERKEYDRINNELKLNLSIFNNSYEAARSAMMKGYRHPNFHHAKKVVLGVNDRRSAIIRIKSKITNAVKLVEENIGKKILIFDELQINAEEIYSILNEKGYKVVMYHSGMPAKKKSESIEKYRNDEADICVSVKALDEGLDVKKAEIGILVNGTKQKRQILQRLGRVLRKDGDKVAKLYTLYCPGTIDEKYMNERNQFI